MKPIYRSSSELFSVKDYARERILNDLLKKVKQSAKLSPDYLILVLDDHTKDIMNSFTTTFDLIQSGSVY